MSHTPLQPFCRPAIGTWRLDPGHAMSLRPRQTTVLRIVCGRVWATLGEAAGTTPDRAGDRFLGPGDVWVVPAGVHLVIEPVSVRGDTAPVHFDWSGAPAPLTSGRFAREVVSPAREFRVASGQAAGALVRAVRGLLGYGEFLVAGRGRVLSPLESLRS